MCCCVWCGGRLMEGLVRQLGQPKVVVSSSSSDYWCCFLIRWPSKIVTLGLLSHHLQPRRSMFMTRRTRRSSSTFSRVSISTLFSFRLCFCQEEWWRWGCWWWCYFCQDCIINSAQRNKSKRHFSSPPVNDWDEAPGLPFSWEAVVQKCKK